MAVFTYSVINLFACLLMSVEPWTFNNRQPARPKLDTAPRVWCKYYPNCYFSESRMKRSPSGESECCSALVFSRQRRRQRRESFWQDWIIKACSHTCLAVAVGNFTTWQSWHAELLVFVKVVICKMLIYLLTMRLCQRREREPSLTEFYVRLSHKRFTALSWKCQKLVLDKLSPSEAECVLSSVGFMN